MAYAEKRDGKLTGMFYGEKTTPKGERFRHRFDKKKDAEGYELYIGLMGCEPPTMTNGASTSGRTFATVAQECRDYGGPEGKWKHGKDPSVLQRLDECIKMIGDMDIADVDRKALERITDRLRKRKIAGRALTDATINRYLHSAGAVLTYALSCGYITHRPKAPTLKEISARRGVLTSFEQQDAIFNAMKAAGRELEAFCCDVLVTTGMRKGELWKLRAYQIEDEYVNLEGDQTKTEGSRRMLIDKAMASRLRALVISGTLPDEDQLTRHFKEAAAACGFAKNLVVHSLRHTRNTRLRKAGVDIKIRMQMLGHKSVVTSMRYDHITDEDQLEAAKKVEAARGKPRDQGEVVQFQRALSD